jgi:hypothetical protein
MKVYKCIISTIFLLLVFVLSVSAQNLIAVVDYMKVNPDYEGNYQDVEKEWKKIHEARQTEGVLYSWALYRVLFTGTESPYDYVTVNLYTDMGKLENPIPQEVLQKAYPDYDDNKWEVFMKKTNDSRMLLKSEVFFRRLMADTSNQGKYIIVNRMNVNVEGYEYIQMENEIYKPLHNMAVEMGLRAGWSVWNKWPGDYTDFNFVTVDSYKSLSQMVSNNQPLFKSVHPDKDPMEVQKETSRIRDWVSAEIWEYVDGVAARVTDQ